MANQSKQRERVTPPHVSLAALRGCKGMTLDDVCAALAAEGLPMTRGAMSAIETGLRRPSTEVIEALEVAYGLRASDITTTYEPRVRRAA